MNCTGTPRRLRDNIPGLVTLINFFGAAANCRAAAHAGAGRLPPEVYGRILDCVGPETLRAYSVASRVLRARCLAKYRLDYRMSIVAGPFVRRQAYHREPALSFDPENVQTGEVLPMIEDPLHRCTEFYNWMPIVGDTRKALMADVPVQFKSACDVPVEADSKDDGP